MPKVTNDVDLSGEQMHTKNAVSLEGDCTLPSIQTHHSALTTAFQEEGPLQIDVSKVDRVDLSFIQLIVSAARTAAAAKRPLTLSGLTDPIKAAFARSGLDVTEAGPFDAQL